MAAAPAQVGQVRERQADAVLRRSHPAGTAVFRSARESAQGLHRHQFRLQPHGRPPQALRAGPYARAGRRSCAPHRRPKRLFLRLRAQSDGGRRGARSSRHRGQRRSRLGDPRGLRSSATGGCIWKPTSFRTGETDERRHRQRRRGRHFRQQFRRDLLRRGHSQQCGAWHGQAASARARRLAAQVSRLVDRHGAGRLPAVGGLLTHRRRGRSGRLGEVRLCEDARLSLGDICSRPGSRGARFRSAATKASPRGRKCRASTARFCAG